MNTFFTSSLLLLIIITGIIILIDKIQHSAARKQQLATGNTLVKLPALIELSRIIFIIALAVFFLRSFVVEPFRIPTGSLEPTIVPGDFVLVKKYAYGIRLPLLHTKLIPVGSPKRGDIVVFRRQDKSSVDYIKRVIGIPGDKIQYLNKMLYINGKPVKQTFLGVTTDIDQHGQAWLVELHAANLAELTHKLYVRPDIPAKNFGTPIAITVPVNKYFVMGDNRDASTDSRVWGFIDDKDLIGKASIILMSWDAKNATIRWHRLGQKIN